VAAYAEKILDETVEGENALSLASRFESAHVSFPLAGRLIRDFGAIDSVTFRVVSHIAIRCLLFHPGTEETPATLCSRAA
jgi:hypothetical protein